MEARGRKKSGGGKKAKATATTSWGFIKVQREALAHPMFKRHLEWIGAWILVQASADWRTNRVNLTEVGRTLLHDHGWDNDRWRRFVKRLEKENFITTIEMRNLGEKIGKIHLATVHSNSDGSDTGSGKNSVAGALRVDGDVSDGISDTPLRSNSGSNTDAQAGAVGGVFKEVTSKNNIEENLLDRVVVVSDADLETLRNDDDSTDLHEQKDDDIFPYSSEPAKSQVPADDDLATDIKAERIRDFFAKLIHPGFVDYIDRKIAEDAFSKDQLTRWYEEYTEAELQQGWDIARRVKTRRSSIRYGERLTFIDLLAGMLDKDDPPELRAWWRRHGEVKARQQALIPLIYSDWQAVVLSPEMVLSDAQWPRTIDPLDDETFRSLRMYVEYVDEKADRQSMTHNLLYARAEDVYFMVNAAPSAAGVRVDLHHLAKSTLFPEGEQKLVDVLHYIADLGMAIIHEVTEDYVTLSPTEISEWRTR